MSQSAESTPGALPRAEYGAHDGRKRGAIDDRLRRAIFLRQSALYLGLIPRADAGRTPLAPSSESELWASLRQTN